MPNYSTYRPRATTDTRGKTGAKIGSQFLRFFPEKALRTAILSVRVSRVGACALSARAELPVS